MIPMRVKADFYLSKLNKGYENNLICLGVDIMYTGFLKEYKQAEENYQGVLVGLHSHLADC